MPRKSRRSKQKRKRQIIVSPPTPSARSEQVMTSRSRQQAVAADTSTLAQFAQRYQYALRDIRRTFIVAAICVALLVGLYFLIN